MINEMKNSRSSDLLPMFYDCKYYLLKLVHVRTHIATCKTSNRTKGFCAATLHHGEILFLQQQHAYHLSESAVGTGHRYHQLKYKVVYKNTLRPPSWDQELSPHHPS